jgi:raffinose/stachyose/melibiose transport system permease protein
MKRRGIRYPYILALPAAFIYGVFFVLPIAAALFLSFSDWNINRLYAPDFRGLGNYAVLFGDEVFLRSLLNTLLYATVTTEGKTAVGLALALALYRSTMENGIFRTVFYLPCVLNTVVVGFLFNAILGKEGLLNTFLALFGREAVIWLGKYSTAMLWIILSEIWMWSGFCMFIFISGLQAIPKDYYEYSELEGITPLRRFTRITLPLLAPATTVVITLNITGGLKVFDMVYILSGGGPGFDTQVLGTYIYRTFGLGLLGQSTAAAVVLSIIVVFFSFSINRLMKRREVEL